MSIVNLFNKGNKVAVPQTETPKEAATRNAGTSTPATTRVHNLIIVDESGSMFSIYSAALSGMNETLQTIRQAQAENPGQEQNVTLVTFDTGHFNHIYDRTPANLAIDITKEQYHPGGATPLYDAMGRSINELRPHVAKDDVVLVTIITDGYENASREYSGQAIKALIEELKKADWVFTYIGANQDVEAVAASMAIDNHLEFTANDAETRAMFAKEKEARLNFNRKVYACRAGNRASLKKDYFEDIPF